MAVFTPERLRTSVHDAGCIAHSRRVTKAFRIPGEFLVFSSGSSGKKLASDVSASGSSGNKADKLDSKM